MGLKRFMRMGLRRFGYDLARYDPDQSKNLLPHDMTAEEKEIYAAVSPFTSTGVDRVISLIRATTYIVENRIEGDFVECGVWRGGSMMAVAHTLKRLGETTRTLYLYDTFAGMTPPTDHDKQFDGLSAAERLNREDDTKSGAWCYADKADVTRNILSTGYPAENILLVEGKVEDTIPQTLPAAICLLRLDTDWYESTKHELTHLYPNLVENGILIIDDYGHWQGSRQATDEYFSQAAVKPFLQRVDYTCRLIVKR